jgi:uncharacterized membrane protein (DUF2068 family)
MEIKVDVPKPKRHGCLTAYLIFMLIANSATALILTLTFINNLDTAHWAVPLVAVCGFLNLVCAIALLRWKKWGFWGFCISATITFISNLNLGTDIGSSLLGLVGIAVLFGVLQIGKENKGWTQLN